MDVNNGSKLNLNYTDNVVFFKKLINEAFLNVDTNKQNIVKEAIINDDGDISFMFSDFTETMSACFNFFKRMQFFVNLKPTLIHNEKDSTKKSFCWEAIVKI